MNFILGTVILYNNLTAWTSRIQQWWWSVTYRGETKYLVSHSSIYAGINRHLQREMEVEANLQVDHTSFHYNGDKMILYYPYCNSDSVKRALNKTIDEHEETTYGFISWFTIFLRGIFEILGFKNVKSWNILWGWGVICSEFVYYFWKNLCDDIAENSHNYNEKKYWKEVSNVLEGYNPNIFTPVDILIIQRRFTWCFREYKEMI